MLYEDMEIKTIISTIMKDESVTNYKQACTVCNCSYFKFRSYLNRHPESNEIFKGLFNKRIIVIKLKKYISNGKLNYAQYKYVLKHSKYYTKLTKEELLKLKEILNER